MDATVDKADQRMLLLQFHSTGPRRPSDQFLQAHELGTASAQDNKVEPGASYISCMLNKVAGLTPPELLGKLSGI